MTASPTLLVVPCYNEAGRFQRERYERFFELDKTTSLLFVNDGSTDATLTRLRMLCEDFPARASVLDIQPNGGKGEAVRRGMLQGLGTTSAAYIGFWDADLATPLSALPDFVQVLENNSEVEMVFGARVRLLGRYVTRNPMRHYAGRVFATTVSMSLGLAIYDSQCGAKVFRVTPLLHTVLAKPFQSRWIFDVEIVARFLAVWRSQSEQAEHKIFELPLQVWTDVAGSKLQTKDFYRSFTDLLKIRREFAELTRRHPIRKE